MRIAGLFEEGGPLQAEETRFEQRPAQAAMAEAVAETLERGGASVIEAGTGVGKSLGYLLPGAAWAAGNGRRLLVSTYTRALQEQLIEKDLPIAAKVLSRLGLPLRYAMLQGADNYLCVQRLERLRAQPDLIDGDGALVEKLWSWAQTARSGHRSNVPDLVPQRLWSRLSRDPELCLGPSGRYWSSCLYRRDREAAERSHVLVVNHALLLSGARLPPYDALIIDEAHNLEDSAVSHFGIAVSQARIAALAADVGAAERGLKDGAQAAERELRAVLEASARQAGWTEGAAEPGGRLLDPPKEPEPLKALRALEAETLEAAAREASEERSAELRLLNGRISQLRSDLGFLFEETGEDFARWVEWSTSGIELRAVPLDVSERLAQGLWGRGAPAILTSATLSTGQGLHEFARRLGLEGARTLSLESPFDYPSQAALLVADDVPEPSDERAYVAAVAAKCREVVAAVPGGVFILFSSWKTLKAVHARLKRRIKDRPVWTQGATGNDALLADFARAGNAVLLGVDTFWQGVDVPGEALSCVVLVKLPFPNIASPIEEARRRYLESAGRSYFDDFSLPRAVMKFRQGFGRLIRSSTDRGAVVVLDSRLLRRGYGQAFLEALPRCQRLESMEGLEGFFTAGRQSKKTS